MRARRPDHTSERPVNRQKNSKLSTPKMREIPTTGSALRKHTRAEERIPVAPIFPNCIKRTI